jgi:hypothetical protein
VKLLVDRPDAPYCFRNHLDRVYYVRCVSESVRCRALSLSWPACCSPRMACWRNRRHHRTPLASVPATGILFESFSFSVVLATWLLRCRLGLYLHRCLPWWCDNEHSHPKHAIMCPAQECHPLARVHARKLAVERGHARVCREDIMKRATNFGRENLLSLGTRLGKFSKKGKFRLHITALNYLAPYAKYKVRVHSLAFTLITPRVRACFCESELWSCSAHKQA